MGETAPVHNPKDYSASGAAGQHSRLTLTGERTLPNIPHENYWFRRHEAAYLAALPLTRGRRVLDAGCGEGFGLAWMSDDGADVVGVDLDAAVTAHVAGTYLAVPVVRANLVSLPFGPAAFDTVVSLQVVEHLWDQPTFIAECARVLPDHGVLVLSTPNRLTFSPKNGASTSPRNPFHSRELDPDELVALVSTHFEALTVTGVHHGERLRAWEETHGSLVAAQLASSVDTWPAQLLEQVSLVRADDFEISADRLTESLDLVVIAERRP